MRSPYFIGHPVMSPKQFFGRKDELEEVFGLINNRVPILLVGSEKIGRTSLIHHISNLEIRKQYLSSGNYLIPFIDLKGFNCISPTSFWREAVRALEKSGNKDVSRIQRGRKIEFDNLSRIVEDITNRNMNVVFCIDEFDMIDSKLNSLNSTFFDNLRSLVDGRYNASFIVACEKNLREFTTLKDEPSPFFNMFKKIQLGFLHEKEARKLILEPSTERGVRFNEDDVNFIFDVAYFHPFFIQATCHQLFMYRTRKGKTQEEGLLSTDYKNLGRILSNEFDDDFENYWKKLDSRAMKKLKNLSKSPSKITDSDVQVKILKNLCFVKEKENKHEPFSCLFRDFCRRAQITNEPPFGSINASEVT